MRAVIKLFSEAFGIKAVLLFLVLIYVFILAINGSSFKLTDITGPANTGFLTILIMIGFGSNRGIITLVRLLPVSPGNVAGGLQISLYLATSVINFTITLLCILTKPLFTTDVSAYRFIGYALINTALIIIMINIMLPVMLLKGAKPLKIAVTCLMLPMPFVASGVADAMVGRLAGTGALLITCLIFYIPH